ncbi:MAG: tRNA uridine-5-carboxymethylaminomethyl(34) synthesis GTPase MnmE [Pseudomonadota bacterium]
MTIYALASAPGRAAIAVIRLSGPASGDAIEALTGCGLPPPRQASVRRLSDPSRGEVLDDALVLWFPAPASYTGEDAAELHVHGGRAVLDAVMDALARQPGLRPAEPGEFTRRAVTHGRMDLTRAEAVADLVDAATGEQRRQALSQFSGSLDVLYSGWSERLKRVLAHVEAAIDFPDEDLPDDVVALVDCDLAELITAMDDHLDDHQRAERLREGISVAIVGAPNVGKSSLMNRLAQRDAVIVSEQAGTTRDIVEIDMEVGGFEVLLADTAGLRESDQAVEAEGIRRARERAVEADLRLVVVDATRLAETTVDVEDLVDARSLVVANKCDLAPIAPDKRILDQAAWPISCATGEGLDPLIGGLKETLWALWPNRDQPGPSRARHRAGVAAAIEALRRARDAGDAELRGEDLRMALRAIDRLTGHTDVEALLDVIFRDFCIGK